MTECFVVVLNDRHTDTDVTVFTDEQAALSFARVTASGYREPEEELTAGMRADGWVYHATLSTEGDHLFVVRTTVREAGT